MNSEEIKMCQLASQNARSLEEMLLTCDDVMALCGEEIQEVINRCVQIIECMNMRVNDASESAEDE